MGTESQEIEAKCKCNVCLATLDSADVPSYECFTGFEYTYTNNDGYVFPMTSFFVDKNGSGLIESSESLPEKCNVDRNVSSTMPSPAPISVPSSKKLDDEIDNLCGLVRANLYRLPLALRRRMIHKIMNILYGPDDEEFE